MISFELQTYLASHSVSIHKKCIEGFKTGVKVGNKAVIVD